MTTDFFVSTFITNSNGQVFDCTDHLSPILPSITYDSVNGNVDDYLNPSTFSNPQVMVLITDVSETKTMVDVIVLIYEVHDVRRNPMLTLITVFMKDRIIRTSKRFVELMRKVSIRFT